MLFALPVLFIVSLCLPHTIGNDLTDKNTTDSNTTYVPNRPVVARNPTKVTRDDQLLTLLAARRRQIIQSRFKNHLKNIVEISSSGSSSNTSISIPKALHTIPNRTINLHLNLSDLLHDHPETNPSTEINVVHVSSPRSTLKPRKNEDLPTFPEKTAKTANMPIIRNILFRRKMNYLNRKLPLDLEQIALDTLGLSEITKNTDDLVLDNEDSLQVEESSHDKLIYYDVKNNASKKSGNTFEDSSDEMKTMSKMNKTVSKTHKNDTSLEDEVILVFNSTEIKSTSESPKVSTITTTTIKTIKESSDSEKPSTPNILDSSKTKSNPIISRNSTTSNNLDSSKNTTQTIKTIQEKPRNTTRFMSPSLYNYFRPLDVPEEEMQPFLHFGEKLPNKTVKHVFSKNFSSKLENTSLEENLPTNKNEDEIDEHMDVSVQKPNYENNKIAKMNIPNQKVQAARDYFKSRLQNKSTSKILPEVTPKPEKKTQIFNARNMTRNRGFRNTTIFLQQKRNGLRQTINLRPNLTLSDLRPSVTQSILTTTELSVNTTTYKPKFEQKTQSTKLEEVVPSTDIPSGVKIRIGSRIAVFTTERTEIETSRNLENDTKIVEVPEKISEKPRVVVLESTTESLLPLTITPEKTTTTESESKQLLSTSSTTETQLHTSISTSKPKTRPQYKPTSKRIFPVTQSTDYNLEATTIAIPTTRILSTAVVTSVSVESPKLKPNHTDTPDLDATVVAVLSNFTSQTFQNNLTRSQNSGYPNLDTPRRNISHNSFPSIIFNISLEQQNRTKFILKPNRNNSLNLTPISPDFIINVPDLETTTLTAETNIPEMDTTTKQIRSEDTRKTDVTNSSTISLNSFGIVSNSSLFKADKDLINSTEGKVPEKIVSGFDTTGPNPNLGINTESSLKIKSSLPTTTESEPKINVRFGFKPVKQDSTTSTPESYSKVTTESTPVTTESRRPVYNTTSKPDSELKLPLATLFTIDFNKPENTTKLLKGTETVISRKSENDYSIDNVHAAYILAGLGFFPMVIIVIYVIRSVLKRKHKIIEDFETELHDSEKKQIINPVARLPALLLDSSNKWEFPRGKLRLQTLLGQGNFGQVWKAEADDLKGHIGLTRLVAVKTIKDGAGPKERDDLLKELGIMQKMGSHPNVVTLLGCCTEKEPYLLIMEYVMYGKLLTFLRDHRTRRDYYNFSDDAATLTARDLTVFAYCVARGMEYLSSKGIIHRDLAARNILVDHNKLCKIADFGMSRDSPTGEITEPRQPRNALPVRWMAIESLLYSIFTHKSDVWSFGVLLWEIVTLGSSPYANMSGREVMRLVSDGYRLERPNHCRPELYRVMARTWHADPEQRPTFADLRDEIAEMLENAEVEGSYVDLESFRADSTVYEIDNCTPRGNYFTVKSRYSEFECDI